MNRTQALEWLVENVTKWPVSGTERICWEIDWCFYHENHDKSLDIVFAFDGEYPMTFRNVITQQEWLDATDNMKEKCDE